MTEIAGNHHLFTGFNLFEAAGKMSFDIGDRTIRHDQLLWSTTRAQRQTPASQDPSAQSPQLTRELLAAKRESHAR